MSNSLVNKWMTSPKLTKKVHLYLALFWFIAGFPVMIWFSESVPILIFVSFYAIVVSHIGAAEASNANDPET